MDTTTDAIIVPRMTTTQRNALTGVSGMLIFNTTTNQFNIFDTQWKAFVMAQGNQTIDWVKEFSWQLKTLITSGGHPFYVKTTSSTINPTIRIENDVGKYSNIYVARSWTTDWDLNFQQTDATKWIVFTWMSWVSIWWMLSSSSAIFDVKSTTQGFLPPRMTTIQRDAIISPVEWLVVYNTTTKTIDIYNGTVWNSI